MRIKFIATMLLAVITTACTPTFGQQSQNTLKVPNVLSGNKGGVSQTAVSVEKKTKTMPPAGLVKNAGLNSLPLGSPSFPATKQADAKGLEAPQQTNILQTSAQQKVSSVSFTRNNKELRQTPNLKALTSGRANINTTPKPISKPTPSNFHLKSQGPTIQVATVGPRSISINKPAIYKIEVRNSGSVAADGLNVRLGFPGFVETISMQPSLGSCQGDAKKTAERVKWRIDRLAAKGTQTLTVRLTPREARLFDLQVDWFTDPVRTGTSIEVTEPKLQMSIAGPGDIQYGEKVNYTVTIRNPGTGTAENVEFMLSEELGGQRANIGDILPGRERSFSVELIPGEAGNLKLEAFAKALNLEQSASKEVVVRRANLEILASGPKATYAGTVCLYKVTIKNKGDAIARDVIAATVLPPGTKYISGIKDAEQVHPGLRWKVGNLAPNAERHYKILCSLNQPGQMRMEAGVMGAGDLEATSVVNSRVEAVADLVLSVEDPKGPQPLATEIEYTVRVKNRGTKHANNIDLKLNFAEGIEPVSAVGLGYKVIPGTITFDRITNIDVGKEVLIKVKAKASIAGNLRFLAVLKSADPSTEESAQGTTKFYGDEIGGGPVNNTAGQFGGTLRK